MLTHVTNINVSSVTFQDGYTDETNNLILFVESSGSTLRKYSLSSFTQDGSNISVVTNPRSLCQVGASSVVGSSSTSSVTVVENQTGHTSTLTGGSAQSSSQKGQKSAGDSDNNIAMLVANSARTLVKVDLDSDSVSTVTLKCPSTLTPRSILFKGSGRFFVGTTRGKVFEIDSDGNIYGQFNISLEPSNRSGEPSGDFQDADVEFLSYDNNILLISTADGSLHTVDWSTHTKIGQLRVSKNTAVICAAASGQTLAARNHSTNTTQVIYEMDFTVAGLQCRAEAYTDNSQLIVASGINSSTGRCWILHHSSNDIRVWDMVPRASTTESFSMGGNDGRLLLIDETGGQGTLKVIFDSYINSGNTYRIPTGIDILQLKKLGLGTNATWSVAKYST